MKGFLMLLTASLAILVLGPLLFLTIETVNPGGPGGITSYAIAGESKAEPALPETPAVDGKECDDGVPGSSAEGEKSSSLPPQTPVTPASGALKESFKLPEGLRIEGTGKTCK